MRLRRHRPSGPPLSRRSPSARLWRKPYSASIESQVANLFDTACLAGRNADRDRATLRTVSGTFSFVNRDMISF